MSMEVKTKRYSLKVRVKEAHKPVCFGLDETAKVQTKVKEELKKFFLSTEPEDLRDQNI